MPGNSDKSSEKPKPVQTVQTLLAAKNGNEKQKKKTPKRPNIEVSMDSSSDLTIELTNFQNDLDIIKDSLEGVVTKTDLDKSLADIVKKSDLETVVTSIVTKLLDSFKKEINEKISEKSNKQTKAIENLIKENEELREQIAGQRKKMSEIQKQVADNEIISKEALQMSNYNQQYSRKFNIKIMNYPENKDEKIRDIFVKDIVKDKLNVKVDSSEIQAIHRIPGKIGEARPVIVKLVNSEVKYRIMRAKKNLPKKETVRLVDDVTKHNMGLITRLRNCKELESAWYFNCSVYGKTFDEKRIKFDIFDDINNKIAKRH